MIRVLEGEFFRVFLDGSYVCAPMHVTVASHLSYPPRVRPLSPSSVLKVSHWQSSWHLLPVPFTNSNLAWHNISIRPRPAAYMYSYPGIYPCYRPASNAPVRRQVDIGLLVWRACTVYVNTPKPVQMKHRVIRVFFFRGDLVCTQRMFPSPASHQSIGYGIFLSVPPGTGPCSPWPQHSSNSHNFY